MKVSYCVDFDPAYMDSWFSVDNYVKYLCDRIRSLLKREVKKHTIEDFYQNYSDIVRNIAIGYSEDTTSEKASNKHEGRFFRENGMFVKDCEVLSLTVESEIAEILERHQRDMVEKSLELSDAEARVKVAEALFDAEKKEYYCLRCQFTGSEEKVLEMNQLARVRYKDMMTRFTDFEAFSE